MSIEIKKENVIDDATTDNILELLKENERQEEYKLPSIIYRFKFTEEFMLELYEFSKIHQFDERNDFKEAWNLWVKENSELVEIETNRIVEMGYDGDVLSKMFKSARYYFRKKQTVEKKPQKRRQYVSVSKELLQAIDNHIEDNIYNDDYQPKKAFIDFCNNNEQTIKDAILKMYEQGMNDNDMIKDKLKKTYKNRYFVLTNK